MSADSITCQGVRGIKCQSLRTTRPLTKAARTSTAQPAMSSHRARPSRVLTCRRLSRRSASRLRSVSCVSRSSTALSRPSSASRSLASGDGNAAVGAVDGRRREPDVALRMPPALRLCGAESEPNAGIDDGVLSDQLEPDAADEVLVREPDEKSGGGVGRVGMDAPLPEAVELAPGERGPKVPTELVTECVWSSSDSPPTRLASGSIDGSRFLMAAEAATTASLAGDVVGGVARVFPRLGAGEGGMQADAPLSVDRVDRFVVVRSRLSSRSDRTALMLV